MHLTFGARVRATLIGGGASLILATASLAAPVLAADQPTTTAAAANDTIGPHTHQLHGVVKTAASGSSFVLTTHRYGDVTVSFTVPAPNGRGHGHGKARSHELATLADLKVGDRLVVQGHTSVSGTTSTFVARRVHVLPAVDANADDHGNGNVDDHGNANANDHRNANGGGHGTTHLVGNVTSSSATSLSVRLADQSIQTVTVSADTRIRPQGKVLADLTAGTHVTVVSKNGAATAVVITP